MPVAAAAGAVVAPQATAPTTKATTTTPQCPRSMPARSSLTGASRSPPMAPGTHPTKASSRPTTRASTAATARHRASQKATTMAKATTPTPTPTAPPGAGADQTTATRANSVSWLQGLRRPGWGPLEWQKLRPAPAWLRDWQKTRWCWCRAGIWKILEALGSPSGPGPGRSFLSPSPKAGLGEAWVEAGPGWRQSWASCCEVISRHQPGELHTASKTA